MNSMWSVFKLIRPGLQSNTIKLFPVWLIGGILGSYIYQNRVELQTKINTTLNKKLTATNNSLDNDLLLEVLKEDNEISEDSECDIRYEKKSQF